MRKFIVLSGIVASAMCFAQNSGAPAGLALKGDHYGSQLGAASLSNFLNVGKLTKKLKKTQKLENVTVVGEVVDVCEKKGCWLTLKTENDERFFVKMKDYSFFVPTTLKGKTVVMSGSAAQKEISVEEQRHYAEDAKKSLAEIEAIKKPATEIRFVANGIQVK